MNEQQDEVRAPLHAVLREQVGDMELRGALGHVQLAADLLVREIQHQQFQDFLLALAHPDADRRGARPARLLEGRIDERRQERARHPEAPSGHLSERARQIFRDLGVREQPLDSLAQQRKRVRLGQLLGDDDQPGLRKGGQDRPDVGLRDLPVPVCLDDVNRRARHRERRNGNLVRLDPAVEHPSLVLAGEQPLKLRKQEGVEREQADGRATG